MMWTMHPAGRCPRCLAPLMRVVLPDRRHYLARPDAGTLNSLPNMDDPHDRPVPHEPECPGVPPADVALADFTARVTAALSRLMARLERLERADRAGTAPSPSLSHPHPNGASPSVSVPKHPPGVIRPAPRAGPGRPPDGGAERGPNPNAPPERGHPLPL